MLVKALYQWQLGGDDVDELEEQFTVAPKYARIDQGYFKELLGAVISDVDKLDTQIAERAGRDVATVAPVGRAILLLGPEELESRSDVPVKVVINEAVELAKRYGPPDCYRFVNAVLDKVAKATLARRQPNGGG